MEHANCVSCESEHTTPIKKSGKAPNGEAMWQWECLDCGVKWTE